MTDDETIVLTYIGRRLTTKDTLAFCWLTDEGEERLYVKQLLGYAGIGTRWRFKVADNGSSIVLGGAENLGRDGIPDDRRIGWEALDASNARHHAQITLAKNEKTKSLLADAMLPIRVAMEKQVGVRRTAFADAVHVELHRPLTKAERTEAGL